MRVNHWIRKVVAGVLCFIMAGGLIISPVYATETNIGVLDAAAETDTEESEQELIESELYEESETVTTETVAVETAEIESEALESMEVKDETEESNLKDSDIEISDETELSGEEETEEEQRRITGFKALSEETRVRYYSYDMKPSEAEVVADLPETLEVYLDDSEEVYEMPVTWTGIGDYDQTAFYFYEFDPVWDEDIYIMDTDESIPYIGVYLYTIQPLSVSGYDNETVIYSYLVQEMGLNSAAACGVLANIKCESDFNPNATGDYVNGVYTSYGICQWHNERFTALKNYTDDWDTIEGQLEFLEYELTNSYPRVLSYLRNVSNDSSGAYDAAYYWCYNFERPADTANVSVTRGKLAQSTYWPYYANGSVVMTNYTSPGTLNAGDSFSVKGNLSSASNITTVTVGVYNTSGSMIIGKTVTPNTTSYNLVNVDSDIKFGNLSAGVYRYKITAKNSTGTATLVDKVFVVLGKGQTVANGTYYITSVTDIGYALSIKSDSNTAGANVHLWGKKDHDYMKFQFTYQGNGYYKIKDVGSGKYLGVANQSSSSGANVEQQTGGTLWQVLSDGTGAYYLVPKSATGCCLDLSGNVISNGRNIDIYTANMTTAQRWKLETTVTVTKPTKPTITGATTPGTMTQGSSFSIKGTVNSSAQITSVTVGVYDAGGNLKIGKTVAPNTTSYNLANVDASIKFGSLSAGVYRYKVTAANSAGTATLVDKVFVVLGKSQTVANGTYYIASVTNTGYALSIKSDSNTAGANVHLWGKKDHDYMKFQFTYQGNGYYKIKDVGSGKYLGVADQSSSSGANVEQQTGGTLWQVLSDGTGSYYLVPKSATGCCLDLNGNVISNGRNIDIYTANMTTAQRWKLDAAVKVTKPIVTGATAPGTMTQGNSFSIKGTVNSSAKITSVMVGVYDTDGELKMGKAVTPNTTSYNLANVDASIKFGSLSAGVYRYKVTAANSAGTATLVDKVFVVLGKGQTVANGTYYIASVTNTGYALSIKSDSNIAGANVHLWGKKDHDYMKFQFTYQGNGYYKIKDVGSGKYLGVANQSSSSGANVEQQASGTLWQVIPDGTGAYYLVPDSATGCCLDLSGNVISNGRNIDIYTANMTTAQRWKLEVNNTTSGSSGQTLISYKTTEGLNYRTGPGTSYSVAGTLSKGTTVQVVAGYSTSANGYTWYKIYLSGKYYYVSSSYLTRT